MRGIDCRMFGRGGKGRNRLKRKGGRGEWFGESNCERTTVVLCVVRNGRGRGGSRRGVGLQNDEEFRGGERATCNALKARG